MNDDSLLKDDDNDEVAVDEAQDVLMRIVSLGILPEHSEFDHPVLNDLLADPPVDSNSDMPTYLFTPEAGAIKLPSTNTNESSFFANQTQPTHIPLIISRELLQHSTEISDEL